jgi:hypothetical protein
VFRKTVLVQRIQCLTRHRQVHAALLDIAMNHALPSFVDAALKGAVSAALFLNS